jgi:hypothetical protein
MLVKPAENEETLANRPRSDALRRYQEEISGPVQMFSQNGDALIDYMDMKRQTNEDLFGVIATAAEMEEAESDRNNSDRSEGIHRSEGNIFRAKSDVPNVITRDFSYDCEDLYDELLRCPHLKLANGNRPVVVGRAHLLTALMCTHAVLLCVLFGSSFAIVYSLMH